MIYLRKFKFPTREDEEDYWNGGDPKTRRTAYDDKYPFGLFRYRELPEFEFEPITVFCGGNGSGKTTLLNVIAEKLQVGRGAVFNRSDFFDDYVKICRPTLERGRRIPPDSSIITSDDVFDRLLDIRCINEGIDDRRAKLLKEYADDRQTGAPNRLETLDDYESWRRRADMRSMTQSRFLRKHLAGNVRELSNGESALAYFTEKIKEDALYFLDEPENSLSAARQLELKKFLEDSARWFHCQFIISTHSPFLMSAEGARIYDLDAEPPAVRRWTELENVRIYRDFFKEHSDEFQ